MTSLLYLDDLTVGQHFESGSYTVSGDEIVAFARAFDPQPFHLDEAAGLKGPFGGLAASGWHTAGITMRLMVQGGVPLAGGLIGAGAEVTWLKPVRPGDTLRVRSEVTTIRPSRSRPDRGIVTITSETVNAHDEPVQRLISTVIVPRRPG